MRVWVKLVIGFFTLLGVIFFCLLLILGYVWLADPFGLWSKSEPTVVNPPAVTTLSAENPRATSSVVTSSTSSSGHVQSGLSAAQTQAVEAVGIDPASLPTDFSPQQIECFIDQLGAARVEAIRRGDVPTTSELWKARGCL